MGEVKKPGITRPSDIGRQVRERIEANMKALLVEGAVRSGEGEGINLKTKPRRNSHHALWKKLE